MLELKGKYNTSISQIILLLNQEFITGSKIRLMPDVHAGSGCTVGTTMTITDKVVPNLVGVDIGCGMETVKLKEKHIELQQLDKLIYQKIPSGFSISDIDTLITTLKAQGRQKEIQKTIKALKNTKITSIPKQLAYVTGNLFLQYVHDMQIIQEYAQWNRKAMMYEIIKGMKLHVVEQFTTIHNYIDTETMILRKGAVSAKKGEKLLIPINMRDGSLICVGKGNEDWNQSAPHGAGRLMSRSAAKKSFTVSEFQKQMQDVYTTSVGKDTLDECPMAYKNMEDIINNIGDTVEILEVIKPIYNFKAGEE